MNAVKATMSVGRLDLVKAITSVKSIKNLYSQRHSHFIDSLSLTLHTSVTLFIIFSGCAFLSMNTVFGQPIDCIISHRIPIPPSLIQQFCWLDGLYSTFSEDLPMGYGASSRNIEKIYHKYYQWVYFVLLAQAIVFYLPRYMWRTRSGYQLTNFLTRLQTRTNQKVLDNDLNDLCLRGSSILFWFIFCDVLCVLHLLCEIWFTNIFLKNQFIHLGIDWYLHSTTESKIDPLYRVFPRLAKCHFDVIGYSGENEKIDVLCFLPLNVVNEKVYVILWLWFLFLFISLPTILASRLLFVFSVSRAFLLKKACGALTYKQCSIVSKRKPGDWFILYVVAKNVRPSLFETLIKNQISSDCDTLCSEDDVRFNQEYNIKLEEINDP